MSARLTIDGLRFAQRGEALSGAFDVADLPRLAEFLSPGNAAVQYRLQGEVVAGRPTLVLDVQAVVVLTCQRCLERYDESLDLHRSYPLARHEAEMVRWEQDDPMLEVLMADAPIGVAELIEDEILLSLPTVPHHPDGACGVQARLQ